MTHRRNEMYLQRGLPLVIAQFYLMLQHINMVKMDSRPQNNKKIKLKRILSSYSSALLVVKTIVVRKSLGPKGLYEFESRLRY